MKRNNKYLVFVLLVALMLSMSSPVFAEDTAATGGAVGESEQTVSGEAIDNASQPALIDDESASTEPALQSPAGVDQKMAVKSVDRTANATGDIIPGFTFTPSDGCDYYIEQDSSQNEAYTVFVTGGSLNIGGGTIASIIIDIAAYDGADIVLNGIDASSTMLSILQGDSNQTDILLKNKNVFNLIEFESITEKYKITGSDNASIVTNTVAFTSQSDPLGSFELSDISLKANYMTVWCNNFKATNISFDIGYIFILTSQNLYLIGCSGEFGFVKNREASVSANLSTMVSPIIKTVLNASNLYIEMDPDEQLKFTGADAPINDYGAASITVQIYPIAVFNNPTLVNTTITTPTNGYFKSFSSETGSVDPLAPVNYFAVADANGNMAQNVVFSGNPAPEQPEQKEFKQKVVPEEPKTSDTNSPWALVTAAILSLITLAFVLKAKFVKVK